MKIKITKLQLDALKEVGTIGAGKASSAFSEILDCKIRLDVPWAKLVPLKEVQEIIAIPHDLLVEVSSPVTGDANAMLVMVFEREDAAKLADMVLQSILLRDETVVLDRLAGDALREVCNILFGSYLTALTDFMGLDLHHHVPVVSFTMSERSMASVLRDFHWDIDQALILATDFTGHGTTITGKMVFLPGSESLAALLEKLEEKLKT